MENATKKTEPTLRKQRIISLVRGLIDDEQRDSITDRRRERRHSLSVRVIARPIGDRQTADGFVGVTRDISTRGVSFFHTEPVNEEYLSLQFPESRQSMDAVTVEVIRCRKVGPLYEIVGKFLLR